MIYALPGAAFEARVAGFPSGLGSAVGVQIRDNVGGVTIPRATTGIIEDPAGSGSYAVTLTAPADGGEYSVFWDWDAGGTIRPSHSAPEDLLVTAVTVPAAAPTMTPTLADVGALVRTRTTERETGREAGTFTTNTRPTGAQVADLIAKAVSKVIEKVGSNLPDSLLDPARDAAALRTAMLVELSFFGDQIQQGRSPYNELRALYKEALDDLTVAVQRIDEAAGTDDPNVASGMPAYAFGAQLCDRAPGGEHRYDDCGFWRWF